MTGKTHLAGGLLAGVLIERFGGLQLPAGEAFSVAGISVGMESLAVAATLLGALLPDIDEPQAMLVNAPSKAAGRIAKRSTGPLRAVGAAFAMVLRWLLRLFSSLIRFLAGGHRAATHWLLAAVVMFGLFYFLGSRIGVPELGFWVLGGYLSHLVLDMLTPSGLPLLMPFMDRSIGFLPRSMRIHTGSALDTSVGILLLVAALYFHMA